MDLARQFTGYDEPKSESSGSKTISEKLDILVHLIFWCMAQVVFCCHNVVLKFQHLWPRLVSPPLSVHDVRVGGAKAFNRAVNIFINQKPNIVPTKLEGCEKK